MNLKYTIAVCTGICAAMLAGCGELDNYEAPDDPWDSSRRDYR